MTVAACQKLHTPAAARDITQVYLICTWILEFRFNADRLSLARHLAHLVTVVLHEVVCVSAPHTVSLTAWNYNGCNGFLVARRLLKMVFRRRIGQRLWL